MIRAIKKSKTIIHEAPLSMSIILANIQKNISGNNIYEYISGLNTILSNVFELNKSDITHAFTFEEDEQQISLKSLVHNVSISCENILNKQLSIKEIVAVRGILKDVMHNITANENYTKLSQHIGKLINAKIVQVNRSYCLLSVENITIPVIKANFFDGDIVAVNTLLKFYCTIESTATKKIMLIRNCIQYIHMILSMYMNSSVYTGIDSIFRRNNIRIYVITNSRSGNDMFSISVAKLGDIRSELGYEKIQFIYGSKSKAFNYIRLFDIYQHQIIHHTFGFIANNCLYIITDSKMLFLRVTNNYSIIQQIQDVVGLNLYICDLNRKEYLLNIMKILLYGCTNNTIYKFTQNLNNIRFLYTLYVSQLVQDYEFSQEQAKELMIKLSEFYLNTLDQDENKRNDLINNNLSISECIG